MVARDTRYLPLPREGIEAFKRRTLDTTRHLTCSGVHSRKPLSGVSYLFSCHLSLSHSLSLSRTLSTRGLFLSFIVGPCDHPPTLRPPILSLLSLLPLFLSRMPRSACDSKPQDTCCIACLLTHSSVRATVELFYVQVGVRRRDSSAPEEPALCHGARNSIPRLVTTAVPRVVDFKLLCYCVVRVASWPICTHSIVVHLWQLVPLTGSDRHSVYTLMCAARAFCRSKWISS